MDWQSGHPVDTMTSLFHCISGAGEAVELWLGHIQQDRPAQRRQVRAWMTAELAGREPGREVVWQETPRGPLPEGSSWRVSVSYSDAHVLCGLSWQGTPGVDLARIAAFPGLCDVAALYFDPKQAAKLTNLSPQEQTREFARAWSLLEARQKACGIGLQEYCATRDERLALAKMSSQLVQDGLWASAVLVPWATLRPHDIS